MHLGPRNPMDGGSNLPPENDIPGLSEGDVLVITIANRSVRWLVMDRIYDHSRKEMIYTLAPRDDEEAQSSSSLVAINTSADYRLINNINKRKQKILIPESILRRKAHTTAENNTDTGYFFRADVRVIGIVEVKKAEEDGVAILRRGTREGVNALVPVKRQEIAPARVPENDIPVLKEGDIIEIDDGQNARKWEVRHKFMDQEDGQLHYTLQLAGVDLRKKVINVTRIDDLQKYAEINSYSNNTKVVIGHGMLKTRMLGSGKIMNVKVVEEESDDSRSRTSMVKPELLQEMIKVPTKRGLEHAEEAGSFVPEAVAGIRQLIQLPRVSERDFRPHLLQLINYKDCLDATLINLLISLIKGEDGVNAQLGKKSISAEKREVLSKLNQELCELVNG